MIEKLKEFVKFNNEIVEACSAIFHERSAARIEFMNQVVGHDNEAVSRFKARTNKYIRNPFYENDVLIFTDDSNEGFMTWSDHVVDVYGYSFGYDGIETEHGNISTETLALWLDNTILGQKRVREEMFEVFQVEYDIAVDELNKDEEERIRKQQQAHIKAKEDILAQMKYHGITKEDL